MQKPKILIIILLLIFCVIFFCFGIYLEDNGAMFYLLALGFALAAVFQFIYLFKAHADKREVYELASEARELSESAIILITCPSIPSNSKATFWYNVIINGTVAGRIEQTGDSKFTTSANKNVLAVQLNMKLNNGDVSSYPPTAKIKLELNDGETVKVLFKDRRLIIEENMGK